MAELPNLIKDLALILIVAGVVTLIFKKLKQPLVLGYIVAGFLVSPHMPYTMSVMDKADVQTWADIGVIFLLFSLGLDFSIKKILKMGFAPVISALTIIGCMMTLGFLTGHAFGWGKMDCIFLGGMLAMSSTTIIYKAFDDMGLRQQRFASLVMSVLILEDILAIVMMVMLSAIAGGGSIGGSQLLGSITKIVFFLVLWFVVGLFLIPIFLRSVRKLMSGETLLIVSLGLCCLMAVLSSAVGFSSAFGAFVMGSILAETIEADKIIRVVEPVKNLFGAIFFVSVGMLVDPKILVEYALPILIITLVILLGQGIFGSLGFMLSGQPLKTSMQCGFSMAQIGEFAFIIASLGLSLGVISDFLYPVVVAVSVITTFLTPYMIRAAEPCYNFVHKRLPNRWASWLDTVGAAHQTSTTERNLWHTLGWELVGYTLVYAILSIAIITIMLMVVQPLLAKFLPDNWGNIATAVITVVCISPFLRSMVMKKLRSPEFKTLWSESRLNRFPLIFTVLLRGIIAISFVFWVFHHLTQFNTALLVTLALIAILIMVLSRKLKQRSQMMERVFRENLRSREIEQQVHGQAKPQFEASLLDRDIHISDFDVPEDSSWAGRTLGDLQLGRRFGIHISSILRGHQRINIPSGQTVIFPGDRLQAIGSDEQLRSFANAMQGEVIPEDTEIEKREMRLRQLILKAGSPFIGKTLQESALREQFGCMLVGIEEGRENLSNVDPQRKFQEGDILWIVGEEDSLKELMK